MKDEWNSGMDYGFSAIRMMMRILGVWPLQHNWICTLRWFTILIIESLTLTSLLLESFKSCGDSKDALEIFLIIETMMHAWMNVLFARIYMKKIAANVSSAIDDWSSASREKETFAIMTGYARTGRVITLGQLTIGMMGVLIFFPSVFIGNRQQVVTIGNDTKTLWNFVFPSSCLCEGISYSTYKVLFGMQILQAFLILASECASDSLFFAITMHLCGQLELLRIRFAELERKFDEEKHYRNALGSWIRRHYKLILLARNIEDSFNVNILIRLCITTIVIAVSGLRTILSVKQRDYTDVGKTMVFVQYIILQSFLFTHAGDTLQNQSESIVSTIYDTTWHKLPSTMMKDLILIMMRAKIPLQISAGKFFYIVRSTTTDILRTALTYVSFLQYIAEFTFSNRRIRILLLLLEILRD